MYYIIETTKSFEEAATALKAAVKRHGFGMLHIHDLVAPLRSKGLSFDNQGQVFEVCNPSASCESFVHGYAS